MVCYFSTFLVSLLALGAGAVPAPTPAPICKQLPYALFLPLSNYPAAMSFCSSAHPVAPVTNTITTLAVQTKTSTSTSVVVTVTVSTQTVPEFKRVKRTANLEPVFSSLKKIAQNVVSTLCSCIETPLTITVIITCFHIIEKTNPLK
jgi:hypothetical protein